MQTDILKEKISEDSQRDRERNEGRERDLLTHMTAKSRLVQIQGLTE